MLPHGFPKGVWMGRGSVKSGGLAVFALALAVGLWPGSAGAEWVDWIAEAGTGFEYDDNLNLSSFRDDEESDYAWLARGRGGRVYQITDDTRLSLAAEFQSRMQFDFDDFNRVRLQGRAAILHKFGVGPNVPQLRIVGAAGRMWVDDDDRSSWVYDAGIEVLKRFHPRIDAAIFGRYTNRDGGNGSIVVPSIDTDVWDQENFEVGIRGNFLVWDSLMLSAGYTYRDGEFASNCTTSNVSKVFAREGSNVKAIARDRVFGGCVYRLQGHIHQASVNLNYGIGDHVSVDLGYKFRQGKADVLIYRSNVVSLAVLFRY
jgi:hypothetical protein